MDNLSICNLALSRLGLAPITSLSDTDAASRLCNANIAAVVREVLEEREWRWATVWRELTESEDPPGNPRYTQKFPLEDEQVRMFEACTADGETTLDWRLEGRDVLTNDVPLEDGYCVPTDLVKDGTDDTLRISVTGSTATEIAVQVIVALESFQDMEWLELGVYIDGDGPYTLDGDGRVVEGLSIPPSYVEAAVGLTIAWLDGVYTDYPFEGPDPDYPLGADEPLDSYECTTTGRSVLHVRGTEDPTDTTMRPALFSRAVATLLASRLAIPLTENAALGVALLEEYQKVTLPQAASADSMQGRTQPLRSSILETARRGG